MIEPTAQLILVATTGADIVFSGVENDNPLGLISMNEPALQPRTTYADESAHVEGSLPTQAVWQLSMLNAVVALSADTAAALEVQKQALRDSLARFSFVATQVVNGVTRSWSCHMGSMVLTDGDYTLENLADVTEVYTLAIPVQPRSI